MIIIFENVADINVVAVVVVVVAGSGGFAAGWLVGGSDRRRKQGQRAFTLSDARHIKQSGSYEVVSACMCVSRCDSMCVCAYVGAKRIILY